MSTRARRVMNRGRRTRPRPEDDSDVPEIVSVVPRRRPRREPSGDEARPIDVETVPDRPACIDLTYDIQEQGNEDVVDLTSANSMVESPIVILSSTSTPGTGQSRNPEHINLANDDSHDATGSDLPVFNLDDMTENSSEEGTAAESGDNSLLATPGRSVRCPVCFDSSTTIRSSGRRLMSTICGHIFCSDCIRDSVNAQKRCPTCRKKLSMRQVHPIFL